MKEKNNKKLIKIGVMTGIISPSLDLINSFGILKYSL